MKNFLTSKKSTLIFPLIAILYVAGLLILNHQPTFAYVMFARRDSNGLVWNSAFQNNQARFGFRNCSDSRTRIG